MRWISTRGRAPAANFREALFAGLAPDGGLYLPDRIDPIPDATRASLNGASIVDVGTEIAAHLIGDQMSRAALKDIVAGALDFPIPLVPLGPPAAGTLALELFHGPTFAFKDVGARVMARLMAHFVTAADTLTVLVATSGDTGSAVAQAFAGLPGTRVVVLFPEGHVSAVQEAQFTTLGGNVAAVAVDGTFDDCQAMVKAAFADTDLRRRVRLTSANSINVGRLVPQIFYYAWASITGSEGSGSSGGSKGSGWGRPGSGGSGSAGANPPNAMNPNPSNPNFPNFPNSPNSPNSPNRSVFSVPSGNFGNLTAGLIAKRLGFPIEHFIAATNVNDVVPEYLASGRYTPRPSIRTVANAMDVGAPSNFERMRALYADDVERLRRDVRGVAFDDETVKAAIADVYARYAHVLDPHSAIAWLGLNGRPGVFLATAHPAKFRETVEPSIGRALELPAPLREALARPRQVTRVAARYEDLRDRIL